MVPNQGSMDFYQQAMRIGEKTQVFKHATSSLMALECWKYEDLDNSNGSSHNSSGTSLLLGSPFNSSVPDRCSPQTHMETNPTASPNVVLSTAVTDDQMDRRHPGLKSDPEAPDGDTWWLTASHYYSVRILPCRKGKICCQILNISFPVMNGRCWRISGRNHTSHGTI